LEEEDPEKGTIEANALDIQYKGQAKKMKDEYKNLRIMQRREKGHSLKPKVPWVP